MSDSTRRRRRPEVETLISERRIRRRIQELADLLNRDYAGREVVLVPLLNGAIVFVADLIRHLDFPVFLDCIGVSSYGSRTVPGGLVFTKELRLGIKKRDVIVIDDILDTGRTLKAVHRRLQALKPASLRTCVLLDKPSRRQVPFEAEYIGFTIPDHFVVGYGLDFDERYRNLPYLARLNSATEAASKA